MTVILVEGESDRVAVATLAERLRMPQPDIRVAGGAQGVRRVAGSLDGVRILGLVDRAELDDVASVVDEVFVCNPDLEGELIRALGIDRVERVLAEQGELASFRRLQAQPAQRARPVVAQLTRFFAGRSGNKARYARLLVEAAPEDALPTPLCALLESAAR